MDTNEIRKGDELIDYLYNEGKIDDATRNDLLELKNQYKVLDELYSQDEERYWELYDEWSGAINKLLKDLDKPTQKSLYYHVLTGSSIDDATAKEYAEVDTQNIDKELKTIMEAIVMKVKNASNQTDTK